MSIVPDSAQELQSLKEELAILKLNLTTARERLYREEGINERFRSEAEYTHRVYAIDNQIISCSQKIVFLAVRDYIYTLWDQSNALSQRVEIPMSVIANATGLSRDACGSAIKRLHDVGLLDRTDWNEPLKDGKRRTHVYAALTLLAESLELIPEITATRGHGGDRQLCKHCGSDKLVRRKRVYTICKNCGQHQDDTVETEEDVNPPDPLADVAPIVPFSGPGAQTSERSDVEESERSDVQVPESDVPDVAVEDDPPVAPLAWEPAGRYVPKSLRQVDDVEPPRQDEAASPAASSAPIVVQRPRGPKPTTPCVHCSTKEKAVIRWIWTEEDGGGYICMGCYSPPSKEKGDVVWMP